MRAVRAFGLLEYVSLPGTRRIRCRRVLEYSRRRGTQRIRFRNFLLAALLYKIEKLGLSMHADLHIDMSDVGLRRIE